MILYFLISVFIAQAFYYYPNLPETMASHFNASGKADGWMSKQNFFLFEAVILLLIILEFTLLPYLIGKMPLSLINMPNKEFWFAEERRAETISIIRNYFEWFAVSLCALFISVNQIVFRANINRENLPSVEMWMILCAFLVFVAVWMIKFTRRFKKTY
jgi:uncharacterized membrane protein